MKSWTIGKRINFAFAVVLLLFAGVAIGSFVLFRDVQRKLDLVISDGLEGVDYAGQIRNNTSELQLDTLGLLLAKNAEEKKAFEDRIAGIKQQTDQLYTEYEKTITQAEDQALFEKLKATRVEYIKARTQVLTASREGKNEEAIQISATVLRPIYNAYEKAAGDLFVLNESQGRRYASAVHRTVDLANLIILGTAVMAILFGIILAVLITRGLNRSLTQLALTLDEGSAQVAAASSQVAAASQKLAEGASEQAASLEETSASLEEIASMTKRNADNAENALQVAVQTRSAADVGAADMESMTKAMAGIKTASDNISKIIKTIDEIAFQTNILALNAAVEAARAGEAGMGFAVVADEVRNLAQRAAAAARETAEKIEDSITKSEGGVKISAKVATSLKEIVSGARHVNELVTQIATASKEQSQGISQVNTAVTQMDKVTQSNAASAEESASASEELSAQAATTADAVGQLLQLIGRRHAQGLVKGSSEGEIMASDVKTPQAESIRCNRSKVRSHLTATRATVSTPVGDSSDSKTANSRQGAFQDF